MSKADCEKAAKLLGHTYKGVRNDGNPVNGCYSTRTSDDTISGNVYYNIRNKTKDEHGYQARGVHPPCLPLSS